MVPKKSSILLDKSCSEQMVVLGMISSNKELFLFDKQVNMSQPIEVWLQET